MVDITLTDQQQEAFEQFKQWLAQPASESQFWTLAGYAGSGKTTLLNEFIKHADKHCRIATTATTNKAVKVLKERLPDGYNFMTIHSLLNIRAVQQGTKEIFKQVKNTGNDAIHDFDLVIIDEASMISSKGSPGSPGLLDIIKRSVMHTDTKVLFCGDPAQLQPVGEDTISKVFSYDGYTLTDIIRYGNEIAEKAALVRDNTEHVAISDILTEPRIRLVSEEEALSFFEEWRNSPDDIRILNWTNKQVLQWNRIARKRDIGDISVPIVEGDILMANAPCLKGDWVMLANSEECQVLSVQENYDAYVTEVHTEAGKKVTLNILKPQYYQDHQDKLNKLADQAKARPSVWRQFWAEKKKYHDVRHSYSLTVHKSQGSTYRRVVINAADIYKNKDIQNRNQLLYVAMTRASEEVLILNS